MQIFFRVRDNEVEAVEAVLAQHGITAPLGDIARDAFLKIASTGQVPDPVRRERYLRRSSARRASSST